MMMRSRRAQRVLIASATSTTRSGRGSAGQRNSAARWPRSKGLLSAVDGARNVVEIMRVNMHELDATCTHRSPPNGCTRLKGQRVLDVRDEVIDRLWNTIVTAGWDEPKFAAARRRFSAQSAAPTARRFVECARTKCNCNQIGCESESNGRHRQTRIRFW